MDEREVDGRGQMNAALVIHSEGDDPFLIESLCLPLSPSYCSLVMRKAGTPATVMRHCGGPHQALQASRSCHLQR